MNDVTVSAIGAHATANVNLYQSVQNITNNIEVNVTQNNLALAIAQSGTAKAAVGNYLMQTAENATNPQNLEKLLIDFAVQLLLAATQSSSQPSKGQGLNGVNGLVTV